MIKTESIIRDPKNQYSSIILLVLEIVVDIHESSKPISGVFTFRVHIMSPVVGVAPVDELVTGDLVGFGVLSRELIVEHTASVKFPRLGLHNRCTAVVRVESLS